MGTPTTLDTSAASNKEAASLPRPTPARNLLRPDSGVALNLRLWLEEQMKKKESRKVKQKTIKTEVLR